VTVPGDEIAGEVLSKSAPLGLEMRGRARRRVVASWRATALGLFVIADAVLVSLGIVHLIELLGGR
jgi:hypothetical protein